MRYFLAFLLNRILNNNISKILKNAFLSPEIIIAKKINNNDKENSKILKIFFFNLLKKMYKKNKLYVARKFPAISSSPKKPENLSQKFGSIKKLPCG